MTRLTYVKTMTIHCHYCAIKKKLILLIMAFPYSKLQRLHHIDSINRLGGSGSWKKIINRETNKGDQ